LEKPDVVWVVAFGVTGMPVTPEAMTYDLQ
jgi:hypothetical protein